MPDTPALYVLGVGLFTPGYADAGGFVEGREVPSSQAPRECLSPRARRGASLVTRMAIDACLQALEQAGVAPDRARCVYASVHGEIQTAVALLEMQHTGDQRLSPARFQGSVHNTPVGLMSIEYQNQAFHTAIAAGSSTVAMALLEAQALLHESPAPLVVAFADEPVPDCLTPMASYPPLAVAFALSAMPQEHALAEVRLMCRDAPFQEAPAATPLDSNPIASAAVLLRALFADEPAWVPLGATGAGWSAHVLPCGAHQAPLPSLTELLPHRAPMLLLDSLSRCDERQVECRVVIRPDSLFVEAGRVHAALALEYMAQSAAAYVGLRDRAQGVTPSVGYIIGARELSFLVDHFDVGDVLHVRAQHVWGDDALGNFECHVIRQGQIVAEAALSVYRTRQAEQRGATT